MKYGVSVERTISTTISKWRLQPLLTHQPDYAFASHHIANDGGILLGQRALALTLQP